MSRIAIPSVKEQMDRADRIEATVASLSQAPSSAYWSLFKHMSQEHGLTLLDSEMEDICQVVLKMRVPKNWCDPLLTGPGGIGDPPYDCRHIEKILNAIRGRVAPNPAMIRKLRFV